MNADELDPNYISQENKSSECLGILSFPITIDTLIYLWHHASYNLESNCWFGS